MGSPYFPRVGVWRCGIGDELGTESVAWHAQPLSSSLGLEKKKWSEVFQLSILQGQCAFLQVFQAINVHSQGFLGW